MITFSIDVTLLEKARFKEVTRKNGKKAIFCDLILIESPNSEFGDFICKQSVTKEEREAKLEMPILGNGKNFGSKPATRTARAAEPAKETDPGQCPF